jgi:hypothetical protein
MPDWDVVIQDSKGRAAVRDAFRAALAETSRLSQEALEPVRYHRANHRKTVESVAVERRILREDFARREDRTV